MFMQLVATLPRAAKTADALHARCNQIPYCVHIVGSREKANSVSWMQFVPMGYCHSTSFPTPHSRDSRRLEMRPHIFRTGGPPLLANPVWMVRTTALNLAKYISRVLSSNRNVIRSPCRHVKPLISSNAMSAKSRRRSESVPSSVRGRLSSKHKVPMQLPSPSINGHPA